MRFLLIEDDPNMAQTLCLTLRSENFDCDVVSLGAEGLDLEHAVPYDAIILDLNLPDMRGQDFVRKLREQRNPIPIVIITGKKDAEDRVEALNLGADDMLTKPFNKHELIARLMAVVRRSKGFADSRIDVGILSIHLSYQVVSVRMPNGEYKVLGLTKKEYRILEVLALRHDRPVSKRSIIMHVYAENPEAPEDKIIDVYVCKIRSKIASLIGCRDLPCRLLQTVWGRGYVIKSTPHENTYDFSFVHSGAADVAGLASHQKRVLQGMRDVDPLATWRVSPDRSSTVVEAAAQTSHHRHDAHPLASWRASSEKFIADEGEDSDDENARSVRVRAM